MILGVEQYLLGNSLVSNFVIPVKNVKPHKWRRCSSHEERRQFHSENVTHVPPFPSPAIVSALSDS